MAVHKATRMNDAFAVLLFHQLTLEVTRLSPEQLHDRASIEAAIWQIAGIGETER